VLFSFTCGGGWGGHLIALALNLPMLFSSASEFTFSVAGASLSRQYLLLLYLFRRNLYSRSDLSPAVAVLPEKWSAE
jgi:hypothetical protein